MRTIRDGKPIQITVLGILLALALIAPSSLPRDQQSVLEVSPLELHFEGPKNGSPPAPKALTIANTGEGIMDWHAIGDADWLTLGAEQGSLSSGRSVDLQVLVDLQGLDAGTYHGQVTVEAPGAERSPESVAVTLMVRPRSIMTITDFDDCDKHPPEVDWGSFSVEAEGEAKDTCSVDAVAPDARGQVVWVDYDVSAPGSQSGFWIEFQRSDFDPAQLKALRFRVRAKLGVDFEGAIGIELKIREGGYGWRKAELSNITEEWQSVDITLDRFTYFEPWLQADQIVVVFDHAITTPRQGGIVIDDVGFTVKGDD